MSVDEGSAHLDAFLIVTVGFLRVQIYKTDLRNRDEERTLEHEKENQQSRNYSRS